MYRRTDTEGTPRAQRDGKRTPHAKRRAVARRAERRAKHAARQGARA